MRINLSKHTARRTSWNAIRNIKKHAMSGSKWSASLEQPNSFMKKNSISSNRSNALYSRTRFKSIWCWGRKPRFWRFLRKFLPSSILLWCDFMHAIEMFKKSNSVFALSQHFWLDTANVVNLTWRLLGYEAVNTFVCLWKLEQIGLGFHCVFKQIFVIQLTD